MFIELRIPNYELRLRHFVFSLDIIGINSNLPMILDHPVKPDDDLLGNAKVKGLSRNS